MKSFRNYIISPFHNTNKNVVSLFDIIRKYTPELSSANLAKEKVFKKLFPGKKYNDIVIRILISDMLRLAEEFLAYKNYSAEPLTEKKYLLGALKERSLDSLFNKHMKEAESILNEEGNISERYFLNRFEIETEKLNFLISKDRQDESGTALLKRGEYLVNFFMMNILNIVQELWEHGEVLNEKYDFNLAENFISNTGIEKVMKYMKDNNYKYYPVIEIYYYMYMSFKDEKNDKYYSLLKDSVKQNLHLFHEEEKFNLFLILESSSISQMRTGNKKDYSDLMSVYELMLSNNVFTDADRNYMQANLFRNIFYSAVELKRYEWAEEFVNKYYDYLVPEQKMDMFNYTKAILNFERNQFETALEQAGKINYTFFVFKFEARVLMLKLYYELKSFEPALSLIDTFSHFLSKSKIVSDGYKEPFTNFLKYLKILIRNSQNRNLNSYDTAEMKKTVAELKYVISKRWIIEKIEEIV